MNFISLKEAAQKWGVSERMVCMYCDDGRVKGAYQDGSTWMIPENAEKPKRKKAEPTNLLKPPKLLHKIATQKYSTNYTGLYDYVQINMAYSNCRLASNRMTREQVEALYGTEYFVSLHTKEGANEHHRKMQELAGALD